MENLTKIIGIPLSKDFSKSEDGFLVTRGYFTSDNKDEFGDIITRSATERALGAYRQWGNIRYMHQPRPVGKIVGIGKEDGLEWNEVEIKVIDKDAAFEVEQGLLKALSIGALIKFEDVEFLEDGGLLINDYQLAEISLVDHPANYDAALKGLEATDGLRALAKQHGFDTVAKSMASLVNMHLEGNMPEEEKSLENEVIEEEILDEDTIEEVEPETEEVIEEEKAIEEDEEVAESEDEIEMEKDVEGETEEDQEELEDSNHVVVLEQGLMDAVIGMTDMLNKYAETMDGFTERLDAVLRNLETSTEDQGIDQIESEDEVEEIEETQEEPEEVEEEKSAPVNREGGIPATDIDLDSDAEEDTPEVKDLRSALKMFFKVD